MSTPEFVRRELRREINELDLFLDIRAVITRGERVKIIDKIYNRIIDILVEKLLNEGELTIYPLLTIRAKPNPNFNPDNPLSSPIRLEARVSEGIRLAWIARQAGYQVDRDNYKEVIRQLRANREAKSLKKKGLFNPFLHEEDE